MAEDQPTEEAQRVMEAVEAIKQMTDPLAQARAVTQVLRAQPEVVKALKEIRRQYVVGQRAAKVTYKDIAASLSLSVGTIQDIERGYSGSGRDRPRTGRKAQGATAGETNG